MAVDTVLLHFGICDLLFNLFGDQFHLTGVFRACVARDRPKIVGLVIEPELDLHWFLSWLIQKVF
jgi:hypothetical protein